MTTPPATPLAGDAPPRFVAPAPRPTLPPEAGWIVAAACAIGVLAGLWLPFHDVGLGLAVICIAIIALAGWGNPGRWRAFCLLTAGALALTPLFRDADWVVWWALIGALLLAAVGIVSGSSWRELVRASWWWTAELLPASVTVFVAARKAATRERLERVGPVARGLLLAAPLVFIFGTLFASADATFSRIVGRFDWLDSLLPDGFEVRALLAAVVTLVALALRAAARRPRTPASDDAPAPLLSRTEWSIALGALVVLFGMFVALQLRVLFGDDGYVQRQVGLTYAQYAREGFGQLTAVAALTLGVLACVGARGPAGDQLVRALCAALCLLTLVVVASAWHRLSLYESAFGATRLRFSTHLALLWFAGTFALIVAAGAAGRSRLLPRAVVALSAILLLGFVAINPDGRIGAINVDRAERTGEWDQEYLFGLSADAAPALLALAPRDRACTLAFLTSGDRSLAAFNTARREADRIARADPAARYCRKHGEPPRRKR